MRWYKIGERKRFELLFGEGLLSQLEGTGCRRSGEKNEFSLSPLSGKESKELVAKVMEAVPKSDRAKIRYTISQKYF